MEENKCVCFLAHPARLLFRTDTGPFLAFGFLLSPRTRTYARSGWVRERHDEKRTRCAADWRAKLLLVHNRRSAASPHGEGKQTRLRTRLPRPLLCVCVCVRPLSRCVSAESVIPPLAVTTGHDDAEQRRLCGHSRCPFATAASPAGPTVKR